MITNTGVDVARNVGWRLSQGLFTNITAIWIFFLAAHLLPTIGDIGVYYALNVVATLFYVMMGLALPKANMKFIARYVGLNKKQDAIATARLTLKVGFILSFMGVAILGLFSNMISILLNISADKWLLDIMIPYVFLLVLQPFAESAISGFQRFDIVFKIQTAQSSVIGIVGGILLLTGYGIVGIIIAWTAGYLIGTLANLLVFYRRFNRALGTSSLKSLVSFSVPLYGMEVSSYLVQNTDKFLVLLLTGTAVLGIYSPAVTVATFVSIVGTSMNLVLLPKLSEVEGRYGESGLERAARESSRWVFLVMTPMSMGLAAVSVPVARLFGDRFIPSAPLVVIISLAMAFTAGYVVINATLIAIGKTSIFFVSALVGVITDIGITLFLIMPYGAVGVAIGRASLQVCIFLLPLLYMVLKTNQALDYRAMFATLGSSIIMSVPIVYIQQFSTEIFILPLLVLIGITIYLVLIKLLRIVDNNDVEIFRELLPKRLGFALSIVNWLAHESRD